MNEPLISVIVPIYKVEQYLRQCVDSILAQTHTNLEVILVDDGSPDGCGAICDEYAEQDSRVVVIHKENGGLSDARNAGLDIAKGDYIGFVDSDDWIEPDMCESMLHNLIKNDCDIAACGTYLSYCTGEIATENNSEMIVMSPEEAIIASLSGGAISVRAWDKLYSRNIFDTTRYPYGKLYEDTFSIVKVLAKANQIAVDTSPQYHYRQRHGSIMHEQYAMKHFANSVEAYHEIATDLDAYFPLLAMQAKALYLRGLIIRQVVHQASGAAPSIAKCCKH